MGELPTEKEYIDSCISLFKKELDFNQFFYQVDQYHDLIFMNKTAIDQHILQDYPKMRILAKLAIYLHHEDKLNELCINISFSDLCEKIKKCRDVAETIEPDYFNVTVIYTKTPRDGLFYHEENKSIVDSFAYMGQFLSLDVLQLNDESRKSFGK